MSLLPLSICCLPVTHHRLPVRVQCAAKCSQPCICTVVKDVLDCSGNCSNAVGILQKMLRKSLHVEGLSQHLLQDANGIRAVSRAIKNILDYGANTRLRTLCSALDAYRETVVRNREAANAQRKQGHAVLREPQTGRRTRGRVLQHDSRVEGGASH